MTCETHFHPLQKEAVHHRISGKQLLDTTTKRAEEVSVEEIERYCKDNRRPMEAWEGTEEEFKCLLFQYN
jgi:hypothetical protein